MNLKILCPTLVILITSSLLANISFAADKPAISITYYENYAPYSWIDDNQRVRGVFVDIMDEILGARMHLQVEHIALPWRRAQLLIESGEADAMIAPVTDRRLSYSLASKLPILIGNFVLFTRKGHPELSEFANANSLDHLNQHAFVTQMGDGWAEENLKLFNVTYTHNLNSVMEMLSLERSDLFIEDELVGSYNISALNMDNELVQVPKFKIEDAAYHFLISKKSKSAKLMAQFETHLKKASDDGTLDMIIDAYRLSKP